VITAIVSLTILLGKEYEDAVIDSFVARLDQRIAERVDERVAERLGSSASAMSAPASTPAKAAGHSFILGMASLFAGIPNHRAVFGGCRLRRTVRVLGRNRRRELCTRAESAPIQLSPGRHVRKSPSPPLHDEIVCREA
jgi:hypothetical protein